MKDEGVIEPDEENEENLVEEEDEEVDRQLNRESKSELEKRSDEENAMSMIMVNKHFCFLAELSGVWFQFFLFEISFRKIKSTKV